MPQTFARSVVKTINVAGQPQDVFQLPNARIFRALNLQFDIAYTTTTGTLNPHPADIANAMSRFEVFTSNGKTILDLTGQDLYDLFVYRQGLAGDNVALVGAQAASSTGRMSLHIPFTLEDGKQPWDGCIETVQKEVNVRISWNTLTNNGVLFGTATGLSAVTLTCRVSSEEYRADAATVQQILASTVQRSIRGFDYPVTQSNDAFVLDKLPKNETYRKLVIMPRSTTNGNVTPTSAVLDHTKEMSVKTSLDNNVQQKDVVRVFRSNTIARRRNTGIAAGMIDVPLIADGSMAQAITSTSANELLLEVPAIFNGTNPTLRVIVDTIKATANAAA